MVRLLRYAMLLCTVVLLYSPAAASAAARSVQTTAAQRLAAANIATGKLHAPYRAAAAGPRAFDCSGLVSYAYEIAGRPLAARSSFDLWRVQGVRVARKALRRGDLVWTWDRRFGHVGIYLGGGRYVHAPGTGRRVEIAPLPSGRSFVGAVRP